SERQIAAPIPFERLAPVIIATLPFRLVISYPPNFWVLRGEYKRCKISLKHKKSRYKGIH
ncbi:hypothetical protein, partial [Halalkalibacter lacteus]|uniref:hypothetical protein n=1 Tax=Halalkalibacter lacteus TaxID=3090663 RepID=UPI002FC82ACD